MLCVCQLHTRLSSCLSSRPGSASPGTLAQRHCLPHSLWLPPRLALMRTPEQ